MCYQPDPETTRRVVTAIPDGHKCEGTFGVTHVATDTVWELMELLQCHVATWRMPSDESSEQGLASQRLLAATAHMLARVTEASIAEWQTTEGDACRTYLADLDRQDATVRTAAAQRAEPAAEHAATPEPPEQPPHAVEAFWTLAQYFKSKGVNVERVAESVVANSTPAT